MNNHGNGNNSSYKHIYGAATSSKHPSSKSSSKHPLQDSHLSKWHAAMQLTQRQPAGGPTAGPHSLYVLLGLGQQEQLALLMLQPAAGQAKGRVATAAARQQAKLGRQEAANVAKQVQRSSSSRVLALSGSL
jgi:hypothetical protein